MLKPVKISDATSINNNQQYIVILPLGSTEYHFNKLPYCVDTYIAEKTAIWLAEHTEDLPDNYKLLLLPALPYGSSDEWLEWPGTISISVKTYYDLISDIIGSIERKLFVKGYIVINGHGGNYSVIERYAHRFWQEYHKPFVIIDIWRTAAELGLRYCHACCTEIELYELLNNTGSKEKCDDENIEYTGLKGRYTDLKAGSSGYIEPRLLISRLKDLFIEAIKIIIEATPDNH